MCDRRMRQLTRPATAKSTTLDRAQQSRSRTTALKHDPEHNRVRLSKGANLKDGWGDFVLCEYDTRNDVEFSTVDTVQNVRVVWNGEQWQVHFVVKETIETLDSPGDGIAGVDFGVSNIAAVAYPNEYVLYPGNTIKQDTHYFQRKEYNTEGENGPSQQAQRLRQKRTRRETHFYHTLTKTIIEECVDRDVGTLVVGWPKMSVRTTLARRTTNGCTHGRSTGCISISPTRARSVVLRY